MRSLRFSHLHSEQDGKEDVVKALNAVACSCHDKIAPADVTAVYELLMREAKKEKKDYKREMLREVGVFVEKHSLESLADISQLVFPLLDPDLKDSDDEAEGDPADKRRKVDDDVAAAPKITKDDLQEAACQVLGKSITVQLKSPPSSPPSSSRLETAQALEKVLSLAVNASWKVGCLVNCANASRLPL